MSQFLANGFALGAGRGDTDSLGCTGGEGAVPAGVTQTGRRAHGQTDRHEHTKRGQHTHIHTHAHATKQPPTQHNNTHTHTHRTRATHARGVCVCVCEGFFNASVYTSGPLLGLAHTASRDSERVTEHWASWSASSERLSEPTNWYPIHPATWPDKLIMWRTDGQDAEWRIASDNCQHHGYRWSCDTDRCRQVTCDRRHVSRDVILLTYEVGNFEGDRSRPSICSLLDFCEIRSWI